MPNIEPRIGIDEEESLENDEDRKLLQFAEEREKTSSEWISHKEAWRES